MAVARSIDFIYIVIYSVQKKNLAVSEDGGLPRGGLTGFYCTVFLLISINKRKLLSITVRCYYELLIIKL